MHSQSSLHLRSTRRTVGKRPAVLCPAEAWRGAWGTSSAGPLGPSCPRFLTEPPSLSYPDSEDPTQGRPWETVTPAVRQSGALPAGWGTSESVPTPLAGAPRDPGSPSGTLHGCRPQLATLRGARQSGWGVWRPGCRRHGRGRSQDTDIHSQRHRDSPGRGSHYCVRFSGFYGAPAPATPRATLGRTSGWWELGGRQHIFTQQGGVQGGKCRLAPGRREVGVPSSISLLLL